MKKITVEQGHGEGREYSKEVHIELAARVKMARSFLSTMSDEAKDLYYDISSVGDEFYPSVSFEGIDDEDAEGYLNAMEALEIKYISKYSNKGH